jgi:hypothetical protein
MSGTIDYLLDTNYVLAVVKQNPVIEKTKQNSVIRPFVLQSAPSPGLSFSAIQESPQQKKN